MTATYEIRNPATGETVGKAPDHGTERAASAAADARAAQAAWAAVPLAKRAALLERVAGELERRRDRLIEGAIAEIGATRPVAEQLHVDAAIDRIRRAASVDPGVFTLDHGDEAGLRAVVERRPVGPVACIAPFNFPLLAMAAKVAPALVAGNPVVMKPAPQDPLLVVELAGAFAAAGAPPGVVNLVVGRDPALGAALVESPDIAMISFTGSTAVGQQIHAAAGATMKRLLLELGGKGALVVADAGVLPQAIEGVARTYRIQSGQVCLAPTRLLVPRELRDDAIDRIRSVLRDCPVGDPRDPDTIVGPLVDEAQAARVRGFLARAREAGAHLVHEGSPAGPGAFVDPVLVVGAEPAAEIAQHEVFGPVVVVLEHNGDDDAVRIANGTMYGLHDYVYAADIDRARSIARRLEAGGVSINTTARHPSAPFGGTALSGIGRAGGGIHAVHAYTELHTIAEPSAI